MSTQRLTFLYPHLFRSLRSSESIVEATVHRLPSPAAPSAPNSSRPRKHNCAQQRRHFGNSARKVVAEQRFVQRHGKAAGPFLPPGDNPEDNKVFVRENVEAPEAKKTSAIESPGPLSEETLNAERIPGDESFAHPERKEAQKEPLKDTQKDLFPAVDTVLHMDPPAEMRGEGKPHLQAPPYVHHFDTYTLVREVEKGGFTHDQAVTAMKAVRGLLTTNLDFAKEGLVSKSDVENETYLFNAACSELRTEIMASRSGNEEKMRRERALLQHEVDILGQKLTQELGVLRDDLKGMFNDRKMAVRMEQRSMETAIQELNYKITVMLNSDSKSEVEGLRWVLTRRAALAIVTMAFMVLVSLRYASYRAHEGELAKKKRRKAANTDMSMDSHGNSRQLHDSSPVGAAEVLAAN